MLTDYSVHCPHTDCGWHGCLFPQNTSRDWRPATPTRRQIQFLCPSCQREWQARIVNDDAVNLPLEVPVGTSA